MTFITSPSAAVLHERLLTRLRLRHFRLVDALAHHAHLGRAAEAMHISQPAATQMLRELESLVGRPLFERHARGMRATEAGQLLALHATVAINALRGVADGLVALDTREAPPVRVGAIEAAIGSILQMALPTFGAKYPDFRLFIEEDTMERLSAGLRSGAFDLLLVRRPANVEDSYRFVPLRNDRMVVIASPTHPAAGRRRLRIRDLADSLWILPPAHYAVRKALDAAWAQEPHKPREHVVQTLSPTLLGSILAQPKVVVPVPRSLLDRVARGTVVELPLDLHTPIEALGMLYRTDNLEGPLAQLVEFLAARADLKD